MLWKWIIAFGGRTSHYFSLFFFFHLCWRALWECVSKRNTVSTVMLLLLSRLSHVRLCATLWTAAHQAPLSTGFCRQEYWSGLPFSSPIHSHTAWLKRNLTFMHLINTVSGSPYFVALGTVLVTFSWNFLFAFCINAKIILSPVMEQPVLAFLLFTWLFLSVLFLNIGVLKKPSVLSCFHTAQSPRMIAAISLGSSCHSCR